MWSAFRISVLSPSFSVFLVENKPSGSLVQSCQTSMKLQCWNWTFDKQNVAQEKKEEAELKHFNVVLLIFWGCLNNYLADVVSMAAIPPGKRALHYQWGQQSVLCLLQGDNTNSVNHPWGFLSNGKDSQIKSSVFCTPITTCHTAELDNALQTYTGADRVVYSAIHFVWWVHALFLFRNNLLYVLMNQ